MTRLEAVSTLDVAVTGASGFVGTRLVAMLNDAAKPTRVRILTRRSTNLIDPVSVRAALAGCHSLVHCAFDFSDMDSNIEIARVVASECAAAGVRLIQISTAAVYEPFPDGVLDETVRVEHPGSHYKQAKLGIEGEVLRLVDESRLDAVILQPTVVYGPHGRAWTDSPIRELLTGTVVLPAGGTGLCNAVYIDDVCRAIVGALEKDGFAGERILVSGPEPVTWRDFYGAYQTMLGLDVLELEPQGATQTTPELDLSSSAKPSAAARLKRTATRLLGSHLMSQANLALNYARGLVQHRRHVASGAKLALFQSHCHISIDKAQRVIGYEPQFDLARGMAATRPYVESRYGRLARLKRRR